MSAILFIFMFWLYAAWMILLIGACIAFYQQHSEHLVPDQRAFVLSNAMRERLALLVMVAVGERFYQERPPRTHDELAEHLRVPPQAVGRSVDVLERGGLLVATGVEPPHYLPGRPLESTTVREVLAVVRRGPSKTRLRPRESPGTRAVASVMERLERALDTAFEGLTVKELALGESATAGSASVAIGARSRSTAS